ncbi:MAG: DUF3298 domain-containing protein [Crocinitomicaceae bacterium]
MKINAIYSILFSVVLYSCGTDNNSGTGENNQNKSASPEAAIAASVKEPEGIEIGKIKIILKGMDGSEESWIDYMFYKSDKLDAEYKRTVNKIIHSNLYTNFEGNRKNAKAEISKKDFQQSLEKFEKDYKDLLNETEGEPFPTMPWNMTQTFKIDTTLISYIQLECSYADYTGGAHGNYGTSKFIIDRTTGKQLTVSDLVTSTRELNKLVEKYLRKAYKIPNGQRLDEFGLFENAIEANNNFYFDAKNNTLCFDYNPYEIGPYSIGMVSVPIDVDALNSILKIKFE